VVAGEMNRTSIEYADFTWNPVTGCLGPGGTPEEPKRCSYCYAHRLAKGRLKKTYLSNPTVAPGCDPADPFSPRIWSDRLREPAERDKPAKIFVCNMGDLFHLWVPDEWRYLVCGAADEAEQHIYLYLTKDPAGYLWPMGSDGTGTWTWFDNEWLGVTITRPWEWEERWPLLREVVARVRWVSFEPLLGPMAIGYSKPPELAWATIGAQTPGTWRSPLGYWVQALTAQLEINGVPVFHKDNLDCEGMGIERRREWPR